MRSHPGRVLAIVVALVVALAVLTQVLLVDTRTADVDPASPEGVVRAYVEALVDEDPEAAAALLDPGSPCDAADVEQAYRPDVDRVLLLGTDVEGDDARVEIELQVGEGAFSAFGFAERHIFRLTSTDDGWRITGRPWPLYECFGGS